MELFVSLDLLSLSRLKSESKLSRDIIVKYGACRRDICPILIRSNIIRSSTMDLQSFETTKKCELACIYQLFRRPAMPWTFLGKEIRGGISVFNRLLRF